MYVSVMLTSSGAVDASSLGQNARTSRDQADNIDRERTKLSFVMSYVILISVT